MKHFIIFISFLILPFAASCSKNIAIDLPTGSYSSITAAYSDKTDLSLVVSRGHTGNGSLIYATPVDTRGRLLGPLLTVSHEDPNISRFSPSVIFTGKEFAIVWNELHGNHDVIYFSKVDPTGKEITLPAKKILSGENISFFFKHFLYKNNTYLIAYNVRRDYDLVMQNNISYIDPTGNKIGEPYTVSSDYGFYNLAIAGNTVYAIWTADNNKILFRQVPDNPGNAEGKVNFLTEVPGEIINLKTFSSGKEIIILWKEKYNYNFAVSVAKIDEKGEVRLKRWRIIKSYGHCKGIAVSPAGSDLLIAYCSLFTDGEESGVEWYLQKLSATGRLLPERQFIIRDYDVSTEMTMLPLSAGTGLWWARYKDDKTQIYFRFVNAGF